MGGKPGLISEYDTSSYRPRMDDYNGWADFWRKRIGVNVIPANTADKNTHTEWIQWQSKPIPQELHDH
jgi:hypothetical protein